MAHHSMFAAGYDAYRIIIWMAKPENKSSKDGVGPVAQKIRAYGYELQCRGFESLLANNRPSNLQIVRQTRARARRYWATTSKILEPVMGIGDKQPTSFNSIQYGPAPIDWCSRIKEGDDLWMPTF
ncbi:hypothetical protein Syun_027898 [Stephania yunnanensis]|uniref:Uncharacterized protein n=1 Tax=Stephania yunnanensis TaxID=152371 RepID=A0AAP0ELJ7_9MAGN